MIIPLIKQGIIIQMSSLQPEEKDTLNKIDSIINYKDLYYEEKERRIELEKQLELERIKIKKLMGSNNRSKTRYCAQCSANVSSKKEISKDDGQLISELKDFSEQMSTLRFPSMRKENTEPSLMSKVEPSDELRKKHVGMIENFTIFGVKEQVIEDCILGSKSAREFEGQILYSKKQTNQCEMQASKLVFPSGMAIKKCSNQKAKEKTIELMSYCYTNLKSFILNFECPDSYFDDHFQDNDLLNQINPQRRLFCICIGIHDYTWIENNKDKMNISLGHIESSDGSFPGIEQQKIKSEGHDCPFTINKDSTKSIDEALEGMGDLDIGITQRVFCIMTYYPFFTYFEQILRNLINIVKTERLTIYNHNDENMRLTIRQTDSKFQKERMVDLLDDCFKDLQYKKLSFNKEYELRLLNQTKITLLTNYQEARAFFVREWIYSILSMFSFESFLDLFTLIMLEDRVVFICENSHILTHTIYFFTHVLAKPLNYPFPVVNIIPGLDEEYLNAPFPVVYGLLKKRKSLQDRKIIEKYDNTYVFLSPDRAEVCYHEDRKQILMNRSTKLQKNKELNQLFKDLKKTRKKDSKSMKYELQSTDYCILANSEEKDKGVRIVNIMTQFIQEQVMKDLPNKFELESEKKKMDLKVLNEQKDQHVYLLNLVIEKFKKKTKDPFILQLLNTQTINNYLFT